MSAITSQRPKITSTSSRMHGEFLRLLCLQAHLENGDFAFAARHSTMARVAITVSFLCIFGLDCSVINLARATSSTDLTAQWLRRDSYISLSHFIPFLYTPLRHQADTHNRSRPPLPLHYTIPGALLLPTPTLPLHAAFHRHATCLSDACFVKTKL